MFLRLIACLLTSMASHKSFKAMAYVEDLQEDLEKLYSWSNNNNMVFNGSKFQVMKYGDNEDLKNDTDYFTNDTTDIIENVSFVG